MILVFLVIGLAGIFFTFLLLSTKRTMDYVFCGSTVSVWEAKLLSESRFMEIADSPNFRAAVSMLEDSEYQRTVKEVGERVDFVALERAFHTHVSEKFRELLSLVPEESQPAVRKLLEWRDMWNLKVIVTAIHNGIPKEERAKELLPSPTVSEGRLQLLCSAESLEQLVEFLEGTEYAEAISSSLEDYKKFGLAPVLVSLERAYYSSLWNEVRRRKPQRKILRKLVGFQVDAVNAKLILRLKEANVVGQEIEKYLVRPANELTETMLKAMIVAEDLKSAIHAVRITTIGQVLTEAMEEIERGGVEAVERALEKHYLKLCKWLELTNQFSIAPVVSYLAHKEAEMRRLKLALRLKADGFEPQEIKDAVGGRGLGS